jgi:DNA-binding IclR family transcriptional regulator
MGRPLDPKKIKSAQRVLEVLEYFNDAREEATVMDIARSMGYPQSSTSELLSCLVALGYLHRDRRARTYRPSARVAVLGAWVQPNFFRCGHLLSMMDEVAGEAGMTVVLAAKVGLGVQYIHTVSPRSPEHPCWSPGAKAPLLHSTAGRTLISTTDPDLVRKLVHRLNAEAEPGMRVSADTLIGELKEIRDQGYGLGLHETGGGMVTVLLPRANPEEQLVLGVCGAAGEIAEHTEDYVRMLRGAVARQLGPVVVDAPQPQPSPLAEPLRRFG